MSNKLTRREMAMLAAAGAAFGQEGAEATREMEMFGLKHKMPAKPEQVVMLVYPGMTALDLVGPQQVFGYTMGMQVHLVWKSSEPITTDTGLRLLPSKTFSDCPPDVDLLFVPGGGRETVALMEDRAVTEFLSRVGGKAKYVTSVCSGSLVLGAAGLLRGYRATSHWAVRDVLPLLGATAVEARYVEDRNRITAGGITSGIDFGLRIAGKLRGDDFGRALELTLEYDPEPPYGTGTPKKAGARVGQAMTQMYRPLQAAARAAAERVAKGVKS
ncbi:ThiJ family protein [Bryobacterales bacterium F-183]|nr:ThiJ family protein [Bryobacterales bacterium F-183]